MSAEVSQIDIRDGVRVEVHRSGSGPAVLLNGGLGQPAPVWEYTGVVSALTAAGFSTVAHSARGVAPSSAPAAAPWAPATHPAPAKEPWNVSRPSAGDAGGSRSCSDGKAATRPGAFALAARGGPSRRAVAGMPESKRCSNTSAHAPSTPAAA